MFVFPEVQQRMENGDSTWFTMISQHASITESNIYLILANLYFIRQPKSTKISLAKLLKILIFYTT